MSIRKSFNIPQENIKNYTIIAHIDHGKSTLSDRMLQECGVLVQSTDNPSLDSMELEREKGVTIKSHTVCLHYDYKGNKAPKGKYILNLNDSPGHVDFHEEVLKSLSACEGSILVVDATQGVEAQTLCNLRKAIEVNHVIIPVINKIDLPNSQVDVVKKQIYDLLGPVECFLVSAKTGQGVPELLDAIVEKIPSPQGSADAPLQALVIDSWYNEFLGVTVLLCIKNGVLKRNQDVFMLSEPERKLRIAKIGIFCPKATDVDELSTGEVGFLATFSKEIAFKVGDTLTGVNNPSAFALPGFKKARCVVFCSFLLQDNDSFESVKKALMKLQLNDSSFFFEHEHIEGWGVGFKCGFLGMFHLEIIQERLRREFDIDVMITNPTVTYQFVDENGVEHTINSAAKFPTLTEIKKGTLKEPMTMCRIITPKEYVGVVMNICLNRRGIQESLEYVGDSVIIVCRMPLNEIITSFSDELTSATKGYCSFEYDLDGFEESNLVKLEIKINQEVVNVLSIITHKSRAYYKGKVICEKLKDILPRQQITQVIQASVDGKIVAREEISAFRRDVIAKCYGGDITRKKKLLEKQKRGKEKMQSIGRDIKLKTSHIIEIMKI